MDTDGAAAALNEALAFEASGRLTDAFAHFRAATQLDPACGRAWRHLGNLLRRSGDLGAASECFERALAAGDDRRLNEFFLSAIGVGEVVPAPPNHFVRALFDQYAERFETNLLEDLSYRAPDMLARLLVQGGVADSQSALDLGCGTGLASKAIRRVANCHRITGVDLSQQMLARASRSTLFDALILADIEDHLRATNALHDLIVACDVFIYRGDLGSCFQGVHRALAADGSFAFTVELCEADAGIDLLPTLRYAHSEAYVMALADAHRFRVVGAERGALRTEDNEPVQGMAFHLVK